MPKMEEFLNQISTEKTKVQNEPLWLLEIEPDYAYGQLNLSEDTSGQGNFAMTGGNANGHCRSEKEIYGLSDKKTFFQ